MHETTPLSLSMISHELKNPLTLMRSTLQIIESRYSEVSKDPLWAQIFSDMDYMSKLLTELSVLGSGTVSKMTQINLYQIISEIEEMFAPEICRQKKEFVLKCEKEMCMYGDALKIRQMLVNLIQNAVEATVAGDVIEVLAEACEEWMRFRVCDTGCGIKTEQMATLFTPFVTHKLNGTGLGMVIIKNIVESHQGDIQVESVENAGTQITILLPIRKKGKI